MLTLATVSDLKAYAPNLSAMDESAMQMALEAVSAWTRGKVGLVTADDFGTDGTAVRIRWSAVELNSGAPAKVWLPTKFATSVSKVDGAAYSGLAGTDYWIDGEELTFNTWPVTQSTLAPYFTLTLKGGSVIPDDLKRAVLGMAAFELSRESGRLVQSTGLGPRSVSYAASADVPDGIATLQAAVNKYVPLNPL